MLFKCEGEIVLCLGFSRLNLLCWVSSLILLGFSRLILLFWFYVLCTTLHVSLSILGYVQVMGNCF